ncbi:DgyrCDS4361 [Dimorphilus gyrociliatus]|uniref:DgyrCDS4361 n=1 Tax=Dimorphilus gyrociliatus TaxID=2664684 RepID=A0A7I8VGB9_9ANNE|nr:DgyrCDS4361 [Dimorphilus gyrociliatus]
MDKKNNQEMVQKYSILQLKRTITSFSSDIEIGLNRLKNHIENLEEFYHSHDFKNVKKEQINTQRSVNQLKDIIQRLKISRKHVRDEDLEEFDTFFNKATLDCNNQLKEVSEKSLLFADGGRRSSNESSDLDESLISSQENSTLQDLATVDQHHLEIIKENEKQCLELGKSINEVQEIMEAFHVAISDQKAKVDGIEENVARTEENVSVGRSYLKQAVKYKTAVYPFCGALIGGCVGGPVGLVAGLKLGAAAAVGGGIAGMI